MKKQNLVRYLLILLTFVVLGLGTVLALILSRGNTITDQGIGSTGTIRLTVIPDTEFEVFLNEEKKTVSNLKTIDSVLPGEYELKIQHKGYSTWQQRVNVRAGLVTAISAQLFPESLNSEQLSKTNVAKAFFSTNRRHVYYSVVTSQLGGNIGIWRQPLVQSNIPLIEERAVKITNLTNTISEEVSKGNFEIISSLDDAKILLRVNGTAYVLDADRYNEPSTTNQLQFTFTMDSIQWLEGSTKLLIRSGNLLLDYDLNRKSATVITYQPAAELRFAVANGTIIYVQGGSLFRYNGGTSTAVTLENIKLPTDISALYAGSSNVDNLVLKSGNSLHFLSIPESYIESLGEVALVSISPSGRNLITQKGDIFSSIEITISAARNVVESVTRVTSLPSQVQPSTLTWDVSSTYFVFQTSGETKALYSADKLGTNINKLMDLNQNPAAVYTVLPDNTGIVIRLFDSTTDGSADIQANLYKLKLVQ